MTEPIPQFATTQWTLVWNAASEESHDGRPALEELIKRYWQPLYSYARGHGLGREDAEDATQEFLSRLMRGQLLQTADPAKGKFRSYLLVAWKRFLIDEFRRGKTLRRGGASPTIPLDFGAGELRWIELESREPDADQAFALDWASSLLDEVRARLTASYVARDRQQVFEILSPKLTASLTQDDYKQLAGTLSMSVSAIKVALHRLRQRFGATLREVVLETVDNEADVDSEITELLSVLPTMSSDQCNAK